MDIMGFYGLQLHEDYSVAAERDERLIFVSASI